MFSGSHAVTILYTIIEHVDKTECVGLLAFMAMDPSDLLMYVSQDAHFLAVANHLPHIININN